VIAVIFFTLGVGLLIGLVTGWVVVKHEVCMGMEAILNTLVKRGLLSEAERIRQSNRVWRI
jgi:ribose/xylose/arabinose/galactoside ABC-type transport system permease subunit